MRYLSIRIEDQEHKKLSVLAVILQRSLSSVIHEAIQDFEVKYLDQYLLAEKVTDYRQLAETELTA